MRPMHAHAALLAVSGRLDPRLTRVSGSVPQAEGLAGVKQTIPLLAGSPSQVRVVPVGGKGWLETEHGR